MWSLPDINSLNLHAKSCATAYNRQARLGKSKRHPCENCGAPSVSHEQFFDIFSEDVKGVTHLCANCRDRGVGDEGVFTCITCDRRVVENYTWELYRREHPSGDGWQCLACAAAEYFADPDNLIDPALVKSVVQEWGTIHQRLWNLDSGVVNLAFVQHILAVKQPVPKGIAYVDNFENCNERGLFDCDAILRAIHETSQPCFLVLDAAYQFSQSIGLYVKESP